MKNLLILFVLIATVSSSCRKANHSHQQGNTLNAPLSSEISTLDPANSYDTVSATVVYQCYEALYQYHYLKRPYTVIPLLAEEMPKVSNDGLTYTIKIKKGIRYHDSPAFNGTPRFVKAQDFITQIKRLAFIPTRSKGAWLFQGKIKGFNEFRDQVGSSYEKFKVTQLSGLKALDEHTLQISLVEPYPQMLFALAMSFTSPMPIEAVDHFKNDLSTNVVGTGPFKLKEWLKLSSVKLVKNPEYRQEVYPSQGDRFANDRKLLVDAGKRIPFLDEINFQIIKEAQTRWLNFRAKKIDFLTIPKDNYASAVTPYGELTDELRKEGISLEITPTLIYWWLSFNMNDPVLKNKKLRLAIAHAVDVDKYIQMFTNNIGQKANSIYPPGVPGYDPSRTMPYSYNLEKAKKLLTEAGYPNGDGLAPLTFDVRGVSTTQRQQAEFIAAQLKKIGIEVKISTNTFPAFLQKAAKGDLQFWFDGWAMDYPDVENSLQLLTKANHPPGPNTTYYHNPKFEQLFTKLKGLSDSPERRNIMRDMESIIFEDMPWVMLYYARDYVLLHDRVKNYRPSDLIYNQYKYLKLKSK